MAFDLPPYHQNTPVNITFLVVDDDPITLSIIPNMLQTPRDKDKSLGEIKVMTAKDSSEAVSTLRSQRNNIDVVITDYHMPGLNGVQLKKRIDEEFGNLPVIVISADMNDNIRQEVLSSGAMCFVQKPISQNDLDVVWNHTLSHKGNGHVNDTGKTDTEGLTSMSEPTNNSEGEDSRLGVTKSKIKWTDDLQEIFLQAINYLGLDKAVPNKILEFMRVEGITRTQVASHLQKYRKHLKRTKKMIATELELSSTEAMNARMMSLGYINPQDSYNYNSILIKNNLIDSQLGYDLGQSGLMMNKDDSIHNMNHTSSYDSSENRSNSSPMSDILGFSNGMLPLNEEGRSVLGASQVSQVPTLGQSGTTSYDLGTNSNLGTGCVRSNYVGIRMDENGDMFGVGGKRLKGNGIGFGNRNGIGSLGDNLGAMNWNFSNNYMSNHGSSSSGFPSTFSSFLGNKDQSLSNPIAQLNGNGIGSFGEYLGAMNKNFNNNNMSNYGSSRSEFPSKFLDNIEGQSQRNSIAKMNGNGIGENLGAMNQNFSNNNMSNYGISRSEFPSKFLDNIEGQSQHNSIAKMNGNGIGENLGAMNQNFNNNSMSNYGSSRSEFPSKFLDNIEGQSQRNSIAKINGNGIGENLGAMNQNFNNNNMSNNGSSRSEFPSTFLDNIEGQSQRNSIAKMNGNGIGENLGSMNWNISNNYMSNYDHGSSGLRYSSTFPSFLNNEDQSQSNSIAQMNGNGNGIGSLGENPGAMNWNIINNHISNHRSSSSRFLNNENQSQDKSIAQMNGVVPVLEDHHVINEVFSSQFDQSQHQGNVTGENLQVSNDDLLKMTANLATYPLEDISNWSFDTLNNNLNGEALSTVAANPEMHFPTPINQGAADMTELPLPSGQDWDVANFMNYLLGHDMH